MTTKMAHRMGHSSKTLHCERTIGLNENKFIQSAFPKDPTYVSHKVLHLIYNLEASVLPEAVMKFFLFISLSHDPGGKKLHHQQQLSKNLRILVTCHNKSLAQFFLKAKAVDFKTQRTPGSINITVEKKTPVDIICTYLHCITVSFSVTVIINFCCIFIRLLRP